MNDLITAIPTGLTAFSATNLDDILVLLLFFSQVNAVFQRRHIVIGQYLGFTALVVASLPGFFGHFILPQPWIGLSGLLPIAMGLTRLLNRDEDDADEAEANAWSETSPLLSFLSPQTYSVAAVTVANGGDNIGIYVPLFASSALEGLVAILGVFFLLVGVWCYAAYQLTKLPAIARALTHYGNYLVPLVLIGLGVLILVKSHTLESPGLSAIALIISCFCLTNVMRNSSAEPNAEEN